MTDVTPTGHSQHCLMGRNFTCERTALNDDVVFTRTGIVNQSQIIHGGLILYFAQLSWDFFRHLEVTKF